MISKFSFILPFVGLTTLGFASYAQPESSTMSPAVKSGIEASEKANKPLSDSQIVAIVESANMSEIEAAHKERSAGKNKEVKTFAKDMIDHHQDNNKQLKKLTKRLHITPEKTAETDKMHAENMAATHRFSKLHGAALDRAYIDGQVEMHQEVLNKLDSDLIPMAKNEELKTMLQNTRTDVSKHLEQAKNLQNIVNGAAQTSNE